MRALAVTLVALSLAGTARAQKLPLDAEDDPGLAPATRPSLLERLDRIERNVAELKSKVTISTLRLRGLQRRVFDRDFGDGAIARLLHRNKLGRAYRIVELTYAFDGRVIFNRRDERGLDARELDILDGPVAPGNHTVGVQLRYQGHDPLFVYVDRYHFTLREARTLPFAPGKTTRVEVISHEKGSGHILTDGVEDRAALDFQLRVDK